jgi:uncharacterized protein (DUF1330 family)
MIYQQQPQKDIIMSALIIVDLTVKDSEKLQHYGALAAKTISNFNGELIAKSAIEALHGNANFTTKVVIQFPDKETATAWYSSAEYQAIIPIRDQGIDSQFHLVG